MHQTWAVIRGHGRTARRLTAALVVVTGCSNGSADEGSVPTGPNATSTIVTDADELCASVVPGQYGFFQSLPTSVGEIRSLVGGPAPGSPLWPDALAGHTDDDTAAWCQGKDAGDNYVFYVATFDGTVEVLGHHRGVSSPPPAGPPIVE